ncbi:MAG: hypothetical protein KBG22_02690 [Smithella sp.]|nr:hypothetical protein [Smithella sp.]HQH15677.1 hypothetical protein [Smithella sp.]
MMKRKSLRRTGIWGTLLLILIFSGCASNLYSINLYYDGAKAAIPAYLQNSGKAAGTDIAVAEFTDIRQIDDRLVIGHVVKANGSKYPVFPKNIPVTKSIAHGIKNYLKKAGYNVTDKLEQWNVRGKSIASGDARMLIGGSIDEMEIQCRKGYLTNTYAGNLKLTVFFADMASGKILHRTQVESKYSREHLLFSENILTEQADIVLADAIEKLFEDQVVAQKLKAALGK